MPRVLQLIVEAPALPSPPYVTGVVSSPQQSAPLHAGSAVRYRVVEVAPAPSADTVLPLIGAFPWRNLIVILAAHAAAASLIWTAVSVHSSLDSLLSLPSLQPLAGPLVALLVCVWVLLGNLRSSSTERMSGPLLREESLLLIPGVGVQLEEGQARGRGTRTSTDSNHAAPAATPSSTVTSGAVVSDTTSAPVCVWRRTRRFVDASHLRGALINEGVQGGVYRFYLMMLTEEEREQAATLQQSEEEQQGNSEGSVTAPSRQSIVLPFEKLQPRYALLLPIRAGLQSMLSRSHAAHTAA